MMVSEEERAKQSRYQLDHRALLFGSRFGRSNCVNPKGQAAAALYAAAEQDALEEHNEEMTEELAKKVSELKEVSLSIGEETKDSNHQLEEMDTHFTRARQLLSSASSRLQKVAKNPNTRHMCAMVLFSLFLLLLIYFFCLAAARSKGGPSIFLAPNRPSVSGSDTRL